MKDRTFVAILVAASLAVKIPIALFLVGGFGIDESLYMATARDYVETGQFGVKTEFNDFRFIAPLLAFVMSGFYAIFGDMGPLMVSPIAGSATIILFYYIGKIAFDARGGRIAALLALFNPAFFLLNTRPLTESLALLLFTASILVFTMALREKRYWIFVLPSLFLTFLARYPYGVLLVVFIAVSLVFERKLKSVLNTKVLMSIGLLALLVAPWVMYNYDAYGKPLGAPSRQSSTDLGFEYEKASWYVPYLFIVAGSTFPFMIYGILKDVKERKRLYFVAGLFAIFLVQFFVFGKWVEERYILPVLPFVTVMAISGYRHLLKSNGKVVNYVFAAMIVANVAGAIYVTDIFSNLPKYTDTREAALWVKENCGPVIFGNVFTPIYQTTGRDVVPARIDQEIDNGVIRERNVDCVIVSVHESPYNDFFKNDFGAEKFEFGKVFVYKIPKG